MSAEQGYRPRGSVIDVWRSRELEVLNDGPAGTGKTRGNCELTDVLCKKYPGCRILWVMKHRSDMTETVLATYETDVMPHGSPVLSGPARMQRSKYVYSNGSEIILKGLDDPQATRSLEVDQIFIFEASRLTEGEYEILLRALRGKRIPYKRIVCDTNPSTPDHWLMTRVEDGRMRRINSTHRDNPRYWDDATNALTADGEQYLNQSLANMSGPMRDRLQRGLWVAETGSVFDADVLVAHRDRYGSAPWSSGELLPTEDGYRLDRLIRAGNPKALRLVRDGTAGVPPWSFWCEFAGDVPVVNGDIVLSADVSWGQGASNSVIGVWQRNTRRKIAEFASAKIPPEAFARLLAAAGHWFGGTRGHCMIIFEVNGPGEALPTLLRERLEYPWIYRQDRTATGVGQKTDALGWRSSKERKIEAAVDLRRAYADGEIINPSLRAIDETLGWVTYKNGSIGPARLEVEQPEARATHGDRVIADMLAVKGMSEILMQPPPIPKKTVPGFFDARDDGDGYTW